jgi:hypothetical protein
MAIARIRVGPGPNGSEDSIDPAHWGRSVPGLAPTESGTDPFSGLPGSPRAPSSPRPAAHPESVVVGSFSGYVNDSTDGSGISGVSVQVYSTTDCSPSQCAPAVTASDGSFVVTCPTGPGTGSDDSIQTAGVNWWMDSRTYQVCSPGNTTSVGTIDLIRDGTVYGYLKDAADGTPIVGAYVYGSSRDGIVNALPSAHTDSQGHFLLAVPSVPSRVSFVPPNGYPSTFLYVDTGPGTGTRPADPPWGGGADVGTILLNHSTVVKAELFDARTNLSIGAVGAAMKGCDGRTGRCGYQGTLSLTNVVKAMVPMGPAYFRIDALGYVEEATVVTEVPAEPLGTAFDIGPVWMTPLGAVNLTDGLSTPSGGSVPWPAPTPAAGSISALVCSLSGFRTSFAIPNTHNLSSGYCVREGCWNLGATTTLYGPPLRVQLRVLPDTPPLLVLPWCSAGNPQWVVPSNAPPVYPNETWINLTAGRFLASPDPVRVNFTVGDYVAGNITVGGASVAPAGCWSVRSISTDNSYYSLWDTWTFRSCPGSADSRAGCSSLGSLSNLSFCIAVPPGNSRVEVSASGYRSNWSWVHVAQYCCRPGGSDPGYPAFLVAATADRRDAIDIQPVDAGSVSGSVVWETPGGEVPVSLGAVSICSAPLVLQLACVSSVFTHGNFSELPAPVGVDVVRVSSGDAQNSVWIEVRANANESAGTIPLPLPGTFSGKVVDPTGSGIAFASVSYCAVALAFGCYLGGGAPLGIGLTDTDGGYNGTVEGGWLPWATYVVVATAPGYSTDWTFGNASIGGYTTLPTLTLQPIGGEPAGRSRGLPPARVPHPAAAPTVIWLTGKVIDNQTGDPLTLAGGTEITACLIGGDYCGGVPDGTDAAGVFNGSVAPGPYQLELSPPGYFPRNLLFNSTVASYIDFGVIRLTPEPWVTGRVAISPWRSLSLGTGAAGFHGISPPGFAQGCDLGGSNCVPPIPFAFDGRFNISVPVSSSGLIDLLPGGPAPSNNSPAGGFERNGTTTTITGPYTTLTGSQAIVPMDIFGIAAGRVWNNDTINHSSSSGAPRFGASYVPIQVNESGPHPATTFGESDGGGRWVFFIPGGDGKNRSQFLAGATRGYPSLSYRIHDAVISGAHVTDGGSSYLSRWGWVAARFVSTLGGGPVPGVVGTASVADPSSGIVYTSSDLADLDGFLNLTTPFGRNAQITATAPDFNFTSIYVLVIHGSETTFLNGTNYSDLGPYALPSFGVLRSTRLNYSSGPPPIVTFPSPCVVDAVNGLGLPEANVFVNSTDPTIPSGGSAPSSWAGQFYSDAPIGPADRFRTEHFAYLPNTTGAFVLSGRVDRYPRVNLTGDAIIAGRIVADPAGTPLFGANVSACPTSDPLEGCGYAETNASGVYWLAAPPGPLTITASATGYDPKVSAATGCPDCWIWAGNLSLPEYATVSGVVRGLPSGLVLPGANVSLCSPLYFPTGPCAWTVTTTATGQFVLSGAPGQFVLALSAAGYNSTYLPLSLSAGEPTRMGTLFLTENGSLYGSVLDATTLLPVRNASLLACPEWGGSVGCTLGQTGPDGSYAIHASTGVYQLTVYADQYLPGFGAGRIDSATDTKLSPILLYPYGSDATIPVQGRVVDAANLSRGVPGVVLSAEVNGTTAYSSVSASDGSFQVNVAYGSYDLVAEGPGYRSESRPITVYGPLSGILFQLSAMTFEIRGWVRDGLTTQPVRGATLSQGPPTGGTSTNLSLLAISGPDGSFSFELPNGSAVIEVAGPTGGALEFRPASLELVVNGATQFQNISLVPPSVAVVVRVLESGSGGPLPGVSVNVGGRLADGYRYARSFTTGPDGSFATTMYQGQYLASASLAAYRSVQIAFTAVAPNSTVWITLTLAGAAGAHVSAFPAWGSWLGAAVGVAAVVAITVVIARRRAAARRVPDEEPLEFPPVG